MRTEHWGDSHARPRPHRLRRTAARRRATRAAASAGLAARLRAAAVARPRARRRCSPGAARSPTCAAPRTTRWCADEAHAPVDASSPSCSPASWRATSSTSRSCRRGAKAIVPPLSLPITLAGVAVIVVALAWPIRRAVKGKATKHLDPFRAMRTAVLAKACSLSGALVLGVRPRHHAVPADPQRRAVGRHASGSRSPPRSAPHCCLPAASSPSTSAPLPPDDPEAEKEEHAHA